MKLQPIFDCFIPKVKLDHEDSENIKKDRVDAVVFSLHQIKEKLFGGKPGRKTLVCRYKLSKNFSEIPRVFVVGGGGGGGWGG